MLDQTMVKHENEGEALHRRLCEYAQRRSALDAAEAYDLVRAEQLKVGILRGCVSHWEYLEKVLGYTPHTARERMRVARALVRLPFTTQMLARGELTYSAVRELSRVATADTEREWLARTHGMNVHAIERAVAGHAPGDRPDDPKQPDLRTRDIKLPLPPELYAMWRQARVALEEEVGSELGDLQFVEMMLRRVLDPSTGEHNPAHQIAYKQCDDCKRTTQNGGGLELDVPDEVIEKAHCDARYLGSLDATAPERATASVTPRIREQVFARDEACCRIPGCRSRRNLEIHHIHPQAQGGTHELSNLMLLCSGHHSAHHEGLIEIAGEAPYSIRVRWRFFQPPPPGEPEPMPTSHVGRERPVPWNGTLESFRWLFGRKQ
jgi:hypothetical protein